MWALFLCSYVFPFRFLPKCFHRTTNLQKCCVAFINLKSYMILRFTGKVPNIKSEGFLNCVYSVICSIVFTIDKPKESRKGRPNISKKH